VLGGKFDEFIVKGLGMFPGKLGIAIHRIRIDFYQTPCFSHSIPFDNMLENRNDFFFWQPRIEKDRSTSFGKLLFTNQTVKQSSAVWSIPVSNADIFFAPQTVFRAFFILTTELSEIVHDRFH